MCGLGFDTDASTKKENNMKEHHWDWCECCKRQVVICGKCGNNTCNGGYGDVDGIECDKCEEAYNIFFNGGERAST